MGRNYRLLDVFTETRLTGNPLAVVLDAEGLATADMQAIASEFNLSETVFVLPAEDAGRRARLRIFTPASELPFAGHPLVGTAVCLRLLDHGAEDGPSVLDVPAGPVRYRATVESERSGRAAFDLPLLPQRIEEAVDLTLAARALDLPVGSIGFDRHAIGVWSAGVPFLLVPLKDRDAVAGAGIVAGLWPELKAQARTHGVFVYSSDCDDPAHQVHARMFAPGLGITEDPATGAAVAALAGQIVASEDPADGVHRIVVEQGYEMGRPSLIALEFAMEAGRLRHAALGGHAVVVGEGRLYL